MLSLCLRSKRPEFLAVYGRRRVGKTFLIREYCSKHRETFREETATKKALHITMVTSNGFAAGSYLGTVQTQVELDDLFYPSNRR